MNPTGAKPLIALTGATGFIGQFLLRELPKRGYRLRVLLRRPSAVPMEAASAVVGDLARPQNMAAALADVDAVIHSAGVAHAMSGLPEDDYRVLNTEATIALARAAQRASAAPQLPTIAESGIPGFDTAGWFGLLAPAGTDRDVIERLAAASTDAAKSPDVIDTMARQGFDMAGGTPEAFAAFIRDDLAKWERVASAAGLKR